MPRLKPPTLLAPPALIAALVCGAILVLAGLALWLAALIAVVVAVASAALIWRRATAVALRSLGARPLDPADVPRLANIVEGLCVSYGHPEPQLYQVDSDAPNAAILGHAKHAHLVLTTGLLESLDRLELEAVVARELSQLKAGVESGTVLVSVAKLASLVGVRDQLLDRVLDREATTLIDLEGVRLTRYPPALLSAYEKAAARRPIESRPVADHLWVLGTTSGRTRGVVHPPVTQRIDVLREI